MHFYVLLSLTAVAQRTMTQLTLREALFRLIFKFRHNISNEMKEILDHLYNMAWDGHPPLYYKAYVKSELAWKATLRTLISNLAQEIQKPNMSRTKVKGQLIWFREEMTERIEEIVQWADSHAAVNRAPFKPDQLQKLIKFRDIISDVLDDIYVYFELCCVY
ncbi:hypothetical protein Ddc_19115 [Ditylenchus destructor]|nr:hypothetical protein Ddc_19115 [Ditylenchus destructor]